MNKKGFTLVELVLSVTLLSIVLIFMMATLVDLKDKEKANGADAKLLVNQAIISKTVNVDIISYGLDSISSCATMNCFLLNFSNGVQKTLRLMSDNQTLFYGNEQSTDFIRTLPDGRKYSSIHYYIYGNLEIIRVSVNKVYKNEDYDVEIYNYMGNKTTNTGGYAASGLILHYDGLNNSGSGSHNPFSSQWMDLSNSGNNGILSNIDLTATRTSGWIENGLLLDGVNDGVIVGDGLADLFVFSNTIEFTFSKANNSRGVLMTNCASSGCNGIEIDAAGKNKISVNSSAFTATSENQVVADDSVTTLTYVFNRNLGTVTTYVNGSKAETFSSTQIQNNVAEFDGVFIGRDSADGEAGKFKGILYSVRVYSYALSDTKIYNNASIDRKRFMKQQVFTVVSPHDKQIFTPTYGGLYKFELWGARGGNFGTYKGGLGGYTSGVLELNAGENIYLYVGSMGSDSTIDGGVNGGGSLTAGQQAFGRAGGGATDIRILNTAWDDAAGLRSRIMVAGGGGGANHRDAGYGDGDGGYGGGVTGGNGKTINATNGYGHQYGTGGSQVEGGHTISIAGNTLSNGDSVTGYFGKGGGPGQSGGGGGYYGGGSSAHGGAGGGSSYISGHMGCIAVKAEYDSAPVDNCTTRLTQTCSIHYSGKRFFDTVMIDGEGYSWKEQRKEVLIMPDPLGGYFATGKGNDGNGYVRVTYLGQSE